MHGTRQIPCTVTVHFLWMEQLGAVRRAVGRAPAPPRVPFDAMRWTMRWMLDDALDDAPGDASSIGPPAQRPATVETGSILRRI
jgi:hypothetical protein